jgi:hypothetical protein
MKIYHTYIIHKNPPTYLELLVQLISVCSHKHVNPDVPFVFVTDRKSLDFYQRVGILRFYDEVVTHFFDDYPYDRVNETFWATPKLWLMSKVSTPFLVIDTDLILNTPIRDFQDNQMVYLHRELQSGYLRPSEVSIPKSWEWGNDKKYFKQTLPINVSVLYFNHQGFKDYYIEKYFNFVLDNSGEFEYDDLDYVDKTAMQTFAEQYLLSAMVLKYQKEVDENFLVKSLSNTVHAYGHYYDEGDFDKTNDSSLANFIYHLWGAKIFIDNPSHPFYQEAYNTVTKRGEEFLRQIGYWDRVSYLFYDYKNRLPLPQ